VCDGVGYVSYAHHQFLDLVEHLVEIAAEPIEFITALR